MVPVLLRKDSTNDDVSTEFLKENGFDELIAWYQVCVHCRSSSTRHFALGVIGISLLSLLPFVETK